MKCPVVVLALLATVALSHSADAAMRTIENKTLCVTFDDATRRFSVTEKAGGKVFVNDGHIEGPASRVETVAVESGAFGSGKAILVHTGGDAKTTFELFDTLPFVLVRSDVWSVSETVKRQFTPVTFSVDLAKPTADLRTLGTGGLTAPGKNPGSYLFLTLADPATRNGVVAGWLTNDRAAGVLFSQVKNDRITFRAQLEYGRLLLPARTAVALETLAIGYFDDARVGQEQFAAAIAKRYRIKLRPQPAGYCTWYSDVHGAASDEKSILELANVAQRELKPFGFSVVQIDDQWQDGGEYNGPRRGFDRVKPNGPYAHGMKPVADELQKLGFTAGIWFLPFARNHQDPEYKDRQDWFVKRENGKPFETDWGGTSLDLTNPAVKEHLTKLIKTIHGWGFNYF